MRKILTCLIAALSLTGCAKLALYNRLPENQKVLFAPRETRDVGFRTMEKLGPVNTVAPSLTPRPLAPGKALELPGGIEPYMKKQRMAGVIVLQDGKVLLERYGLGLNANGRWTSFSVAKSITSTLVGAAIRDGAIKSLDDDVTRYIPELKGSGYDGVSVRQLLTMTSGIRWTENYSDPKSDVAQFITQKVKPGQDATIEYMRHLPREAPPGTKWLYKTGESNLVGVLVSRATGKSLAQYLSEKIWRPYGMEREAIWYLDSGGHELGGCCLSASLRDYARFGQFILDGGRIDDREVLADKWTDLATRNQLPAGAGPRGYGYQWWTNSNGSFAAIGIFGQSIAIDPTRKLVIAIVGNWPKATGPREVSMNRAAFFQAVTRALDGKPPL